VYVERTDETVHSAESVSTDNGRARSWILASLALAVMVAAGFCVGVIAATRGWPVPGIAITPSPLPGGVMVRPDESIMGAVRSALPGTAVIVEPGEYREQVTLRDGVRVMSRVPRAATIRLPADAAESEAAVVAAGVAGAELSGFRIVGDAASPLGVGVIARDAAVRLVDLDISGAATAALDLGAGDVVVSGSFIHDNAGSAVIVRGGARPRVANSVFAVNGPVERLSPSIVVESGAAPVWSQNVFNGMTAHAVGGLDAAGRAALVRDNWFVRPVPAAAPAVRREGPGR
jgi:hypothetical protein